MTTRAPLERKPADRPCRWSRVDYRRLGKLGFFAGGSNSFAGKSSR